MTTQTVALLNRLVTFKCVCVCVFKAGEFQFRYQRKLAKRMERKGILVIIQGIFLFFWTRVKVLYCSIFQTIESSMSGSNALQAAFLQN